MGRIKKILIANRGEIALRIIRSARELGIKTVAVFSEADRHALHVRLADEGVCIGPPPSSESYLNIKKIIKAALDHKADAIHPGYGFLSENPEFAEAVEKERLIFIGPSARSIRIMGSKLTAKKAVKEFNIPLIPGTDHAIDDISKAAKIAEKIGFPIMIKASAGGGGKGMRIVNDKRSLSAEMDRAVSEAKSAFGDGSVFIEKFIKSPRHIEFQILGDQNGNYVHLFERECSIQRRHQKVVEEAPSSVLDPGLREEMGIAAIQVAKSCGYFGAGTVEFMVDKNHNFYFLEMNTRLQVEHPVTEVITGLDLVKLQIHIAEGQPLPFEQKELSFNGHAIELRVYAEDPANNFLPVTGKLSLYKRPQGPGIRIDDGFEGGMDIPIHYDPMIAKLVTSGKNREEAIDRMVRAIDEYYISGIKTTLGFGRYVMNHKAFRKGDYNTNFVTQYFKSPHLNNGVVEDDSLKIAALFSADLYHKAIKSSQSSNIKNSPKWKSRQQDT